MLAAVWCEALRAREEGAEGEAEGAVEANGCDHAAVGVRVAAGGLASEPV